MSEENKKKDWFNTYKSIRKPMPPPEKVIRNEKDLKKEERWNWRDWEKDEDEDIT